MKFEFGDLYKFFVSLGVVLFTIALVTPWLFLREPFDLFKTEKEISELTSVAKEAVAERQELALTVIQLLPIFSVSGVSLGLVLGIFGLQRWHRNQRILDERTRIKLELSKQTLRQATLDEVEERREFETRESLEQAREANEEESIPRSTIASEALNIERRLVQRLREVLGEKYEVLTEKIVGGAFVDIALRAKNLFTKDYLVELKYIRRGFNYGWLKEVALKLRYISTLYAQVENRIPNTVLLIVSQPDIWSDRKYQAYLDKLAEDFPRRRGKHRVVYLTPGDLNSLSATEFQRKIGVYA